MSLKCSDIDLITKIEKNLYLIEDTCESLGSMFKNKYFGTFGSFELFHFIIPIKLRLVKVE